MSVERPILAFELYGRGKSVLPAHFIGAGINSQESPVPSAHSWESPGKPEDSLPGLFIGATSDGQFVEPCKNASRTRQRGARARRRGMTLKFHILCAWLGIYKGLFIHYYHTWGLRGEGQWIFSHLFPGQAEKTENQEQINEPSQSRFQAWLLPHHNKGQRHVNLVPIGRTHPCWSVAQPNLWTVHEFRRGQEGLEFGKTRGGPSRENRSTFIWYARYVTFDLGPLFQQFSGLNHFVHILALRRVCNADNVYRVVHLVG